ncbi:MAG: TetR/AcrR family transcriptional regulator [Paludibacteraceae bacterium]|nr:TetR/AcrR family transcriptional regulator [Paludibacteraceae bacterium]
MSEDTKERIIIEAQNLFCINGIKRITMDEIAERMSISKRTIYENFKDKNELVLECLRHLQKQFENEEKQIEANYNNVVEIMMYHTLLIQNSLKNISLQFWEDLKNIKFPADYHNKKSEEKRIKLEMAIQRGIREGYYRESVNAEVVSIAFCNGIRNLVKDCIETNPKHNINNIVTMFISILLRGICTNKGLEICDKLEKRITFNFMQ